MSRLTPILAGEVNALVLKLDAPLSFWGGVDHLDGIIIDQSHPQKGICIAGKALVLPMVRGSGGTPGTLASLMKIGCGPAAIVLGSPEANVVAGSLVGQKLYGEECPVFLAERADLDAILADARLTIEPDGNWSQTRSPSP